MQECYHFVMLSVCEASPVSENRREILCAATNVELQ